MAPKIVTSHVYPPIPDRQFDWLAHYEGDDEYPHLHGYGPTEAEAIDDLKRLHAELDEEDAPDDEANFPFSGSF